MRKKILAIVLCVLPYTIICNAQDVPQIDRTKKAQSTKTITPTKSSKASQSKSATKANTLSVSPSKLSFPASGGSKTVEVTASGTWNIETSTYDWGHLTRNGNTLTLRVDANSSSTARTDYFEIKSGDKTVRVNISQEKAEILLVSSEQLSFPASGGSKTVEVTASGTWNIGTRTYDWGHLTTNGNTVVVRIDANGNTNARGDYFTIKSGDLEKRINISQSGVTLTAQDLERIEKEKYESACQKGTTDALLEYLRTYPNGKYANSASNKIAIAKAKSFTIYSNKYTFDDALKYAKDNSTRAIVESYIKDVKKKANGNYVQFGLEPMDISWNCFTRDYLDLLYYNVGLSIKFGNYRSPVQFEIGAKPGVVFSFSNAIDNDFTTKFHMPIYAKIKLNICDVGYSSKLYIAGLGYYNVIRDKIHENRFAAGGGIGFAWRHWDWLTLYYKQELSNECFTKNKFIGSSLVYYF